MVRILLHYLLPFIAPTLFWMLWAWWLDRRARKRGEIAPNLGVRIGRGPWPWLIIAGVVLTAVSLFTIAVTSGAPPDAGEYTAPRLEDGKIIPPSYD
ncbi:MAG: DUF6111 family protein [Rhodospirillales bacterium]